VVQAAIRLGVEDGARLRVDTTVVETAIHWPTDSGLLWDAGRVLTRLGQTRPPLLVPGAVLHRRGQPDPLVGLL
jgi:hypothetical protein